MRLASPLEILTVFVTGAIMTTIFSTPVFAVNTVGVPEVLPASSPMVKWVGRTATTSNGGVTFDWEGVTAQIAVGAPFTYVVVDIIDQCAGTSVGGGSRWGVTMKSNIMTVTTHHHRIQTFYSGPLVSTYYLYSNPSNSCDPNCNIGNVTFSLIRLTESRLSGCTEKEGLTVLGFKTDGTFIPIPPSNKSRPVRRMGFVGNSITAGDLNDAGLLDGGKDDTTCANAAFNNDVTSTMGAFLCGSLYGFDADCVYTAWGGITLGDSDQGWGMSQLFPALFSSVGHGTEYGTVNFKGFPLDAIVINLGTNDWGYIQNASSDATKRWITTYTQFVNDVVIKYYDALNTMTVFLAYGPMNALYRPYVEEIIANSVKIGIRAYPLDLTLSHELRGCYGHPSAEDNLEQALTVKKYMAEVLGWD